MEIQASGTSDFAGFTGQSCGTTNPCSFKLTANTVIAATFNLEPVDPPAGMATLTVSKQGSGGGTVTSLPVGINCPGTCAKDFLLNTSVTLTAAADAKSTFTGFAGGGCTGGTGPCQVIANAAKTVTATFAKKTFTVTVTKAGTGSGVVRSNLAGIDCGTTCTATYDVDTPLVLTATPNAGSSFTGFTGGTCVVGSASCIFGLTANVTLTATFGSAAAKLSLRWMDNADNETGFTVEQKQGAGGVFVAVATIPASPDKGATMAYEDTNGLVLGTVYCYRVAAFNGGGTSPFTPEACATAHQ